MTARNSELARTPVGPPLSPATAGRPRRLDALVPALLQFAAALLLLGAGAVLFRSFRAHGRPGPVLVAAWVTLTGAVLWTMRRTLEHTADRIRFGGDSSYHSMRVLLRQLATALPVDEVVPKLAESLGRSAHSARTEVRIPLDGNDRWTQVWPHAAPPPSESLTMQIHHLGSAVGEVVFDTGAGAGQGRRQLEQMTGSAGLAMSTVKRTWELRRRVADLQLINDQMRVSEARLRAARSTEQARLQAEVDARVLPALRSAVGIVAALAAAPPGTARSEAAVLEASTELTGALDRLRSIARGIFPPRLDEDGLPGSLRSWADLAGNDVVLDVAGPPGRLHSDPELETCLYFCIVTVLRAATTTAGHAARVQLRFEADRVRFDVVLPLSAGVSEPVLVAVRDRLEAFGGVLDTSARAGDPTLSGLLPMTERPTGLPAPPGPPPAARSGAGTAIGSGASTGVGAG